MEICRKAFDSNEGLEPGFAEALCAQLAEKVGTLRGETVAQAFIDGASELAHYASQAFKDNENALDAECEAVAVSRRVVRPLLQAKLQGRLDELDQQTKGVAAPCPKCAQATESEGRRRRTWKSVLGLLRLKRRYSCCTSCKAGIAPAQQALGLPDGEFTARLEEVCTMMATTVPHGMATELVDKLCGIDVSVKAVQDMTERRGMAVVSEDQAESQEHTPFLLTGLSVPTQTRPDDSSPSSAAPKVAYVEIDGVVPITREELTGKELSATDRRRQKRAKKQKARGGKGRRYRIVGREVKNAVLYDGKDCVAESPSRGSILDKTYVSHLGNWVPFALLLWVAMLRKRFDGAKLLIVLSDGSEWIRSLANWFPIEAFLILDLYHVKRRIFEVAHAVFGEHTREARAWAEVQGDRIEAGNITHVIEALSFLAPRRAQTRKLIADLKGYLDNNRDRMKYPEYRRRGLRISSAAVESANFHVTGTRLKLQGMRWSAEGAAQMAVLRADLFNGRWEARTRQLLAA
ncbi:MAG: ISKra4 family transposase [Deltaproteobacteria bacterium]|nr:ISKra4 family transposase [Deltaproteobacteria bacterium]